MLCKQMALEWGEHGIRVNSVSPGMIMTPMTQAIYRDETVARAARSYRAAATHRLAR